MLIVTENGEAIGAHHTVRFFVQPDQPTQSASASIPDAVPYRLTLQLTNRQRVIAAEGLDKVQARLLFREVVRAWTRGQACVDIAPCLPYGPYGKRIQKGAPVQTGYLEVCL